MELLLETTSDLPDSIKHTYLVDGMKMLGYIREGTKKMHMFEHPMSFNKRYRTFKILPYKAATSTVGNVRTVIGSKGNQYQVNDSEGGLRTCTCPGFTYRGTCRHLTKCV